MTAAGEPNAGRPGTPVEHVAHASVDGDTVAFDELDEKLAAFHAFRKSDSDAADELLESLGASGEVDRDIVLELAAPRPLGHPDRFLKAHTLVVRALEVLDRNGARGVSVNSRWLGPLRPVAGFFVQQVTHFIVRQYVSTVVDHLQRLYARREANCLPDDDQRLLLTRARRHIDRITPGFKRNPLGVPTFLLGGAVLSTVISVIQQALLATLSNPVIRVAVVVITFALVAGAGWAVLRGAATARRRINLTIDEPLAALYEVIGRCGDPPRDHAQIFALIATAIILVVGFVAPIGIGISWLLG